MNLQPVCCYRSPAFINLLMEIPYLWALAEHMEMTYSQEELWHMSDKVKAEKKPISVLGRRMRKGIAKKLYVLADMLYDEKKEEKPIQALVRV